MSSNEDQHYQTEAKANASIMLADHQQRSLVSLFFLFNKCLPVIYLMPNWFASQRMVGLQKFSFRDLALSSAGQFDRLNKNEEE